MSILSSLPPELINLILLYLSSHDILNLSQCIPLTISSKVYHHAFPDHTRLPHYNLSVFKQRANCSLYMFGLNRKAPGDASRTYPLLEMIPVPLKVSFPGIIGQVGVLIGAVQVLEGDGCVYTASTVSAPQMLKAASTVIDDYSRRRSRMTGGRWDRTPRCVVDFSEKFYENPVQTIRMATITPGPLLHDIDRNGMLWMWEISKQATPTVPFCLVQNGQLMQGDIVEVKSHARGLVCKVAGRGIVRSSAQYASFLFPSNGIRGGCRCFDDHLCYLRMESMPDTQTAGDFIVFQGLLVYLDAAGRVKETLLYGSSEIMPQPDKSLSVKIKALNSFGPFCQLVGSSKRFGLVACDGTVVVFTCIPIDGHLDTSYEVINNFCDVGVASIAVTRFHCLLLTKSGDVYSWGKEQNSCGCLGLGRTSQILELPSAFQDQDIVTVSSPTKVDLPGKALAVFADAGTSAVLVDDWESNDH